VRRRQQAREKRTHVGNFRSAYVGSLPETGECAALPSLRRRHHGGGGGGGEGGGGGGGEGSCWRDLLAEVLIGRGGGGGGDRERRGRGGALFRGVDREIVRLLVRARGLLCVLLNLPLCPQEIEA